MELRCGHAHSQWMWSSNISDSSPKGRLWNGAQWLRCGVHRPSMHSLQHTLLSRFEHRHVWDFVLLIGYVHRYVPCVYPEWDDCECARDACSERYTTPCRLFQHPPSECARMWCHFQCEGLDNRPSHGRLQFRSQHCRPGHQSRRSKFVVVRFSLLQQGDVCFLPVRHADADLQLTITVVRYACVPGDVPWYLWVELGGRMPTRW